MSTTEFRVPATPPVNAGSAAAGTLERGVAFGAMIAATLLVVVLAVAGGGAGDAAGDWVAASSAPATARVNDLVHRSDDTVATARPPISGSATVSRRLSGREILR